MPTMPCLRRRAAGRRIIPPFYVFEDDEFSGACRNSGGDLDSAPGEA